MIFDRNENKPVIALLGAGSMGTAIVRRIAAGKKIMLGDISEKNLDKVSHDFQYSGYDVETMIVNALEKDSVEAFARKAASLGPVMYFIDTAGASPNQAKPEHIIASHPSSQNPLFPFLKGGIHWRSGIRPRRHDSSGR